MANFLKSVHAQDDEKLMNYYWEFMYGDQKLASYISLGNYYDSVNYEEFQLKYFQEAAEDSTVDERTKLELLLLKSSLATRSKKFNEAIQYLDPFQESFSPSYNDLSTRAFIFIANNYYQLSELENAGKFYSMAYLMSNKVLDFPAQQKKEILYNILFICNRISENGINNFSDCDFIDETVKDELVKINNEIAYRKSLNEVSENIKQRRFENAQNIINQLWKSEEVTNSSKLHPRILNFEAIIFLLNSNSIDAEIKVKKAIDIALRNNDSESLLHSYEIASKIFQLSDNYKVSQEYLQAIQELEEKIIAEKEEQDILEANRKRILRENEDRILELLRAKFDAEAKEQKMALENEKRIRDLKLIESENAQLQSARLLAIAEKEKIKSQQEALSQSLKLSEQKARKEKLERDLAIQVEQTKAEEAKADAAKAENEREDEKRKAQDRLNFTIAMIGLVILLAGGIFLWYSRIQNRKLTSKNSEIKKQQKELSKSNHKVKNSINAAKYIQDSMLPHIDIFKHYLSDVIILFRPKDVVSGDFYWAEIHKNILFFAVVDCTGHGVPGAMVSMIAKAIMSKVTSLYTHEPLNNLLDKIHNELWDQLNQQAGKNHDGMDLALCALELNNNDQVRLRYAGARRGLLHFPANNEGFDFYEPTKKGIGGKQNQKRTFEETTIAINKGDKIFMYSDGLPDQMNPEGKKLMERGVKNILKNLSHKDLQTINKELNVALDEHQNGYRQLDDILLFGAEI